MEQIVGFLGYLWLLGAVVLATLTLSSVCLALAGRFGSLRLKADSSTRSNAALPLRDAEIYADDARKAVRLFARWMFFIPL